MITQEEKLNASIEGKLLKYLKKIDIDGLHSTIQSARQSMSQDTPIILLFNKRSAFEHIRLYRDSNANMKSVEEDIWVISVTSRSMDRARIIGRFKLSLRQRFRIALEIAGRWKRNNIVMTETLAVSLDHNTNANHKWNAKIPLIITVLGASIIILLIPLIEITYMW
eukprot:1393172-Amorphochlora_amoeboformis.AAC.1